MPVNSKNVACEIRLVLVCYTKTSFLFIYNMCSDYVFIGCKCCWIAFTMFTENSLLLALVSTTTCYKAVHLKHKQLSDYAIYLNILNSC